MKYILLPIHPEWCCKLMNGDKETEVRRGTVLYNAVNRLIKEQGEAPCLIYCTMGKPTLLPKNERRGRFMVAPYGEFEKNPLNGKVVAQFEASAEEIGFDYRADFYGYRTDTLDEVRLGVRSCLCAKELENYLRREKGTAIHVKLGTMRTDGFPKNLSDYGVKKAPQSFMYVEVDE